MDGEIQCDRLPCHPAPQGMNCTETYLEGECCPTFKCVGDKLPGPGSASHVIDNAESGTTSETSTNTVTKEPLEDTRGQVTDGVTAVVPITGDDVTDEAVTKLTTTDDSNTSDGITVLDGIVPETVTETDLPTTEETSNEERATPEPSIDEISTSPSTDITGTDEEEVKKLLLATMLPMLQRFRIPILRTYLLTLLLVMK